jgi:trimeric autotransporter adhesin
MKTNSRALQLLLACAAMALGISGCDDSNSELALMTIGGTVTGLAGSVTLVNTTRDSQLIVSADGTFTFATRQGESSPYSVAVLTQPAGQTCTVTNGSGTVGGANVTDVSVVCAANTVTLGGTVSGLSGTVILQRAGGEALSISGNGAFAFPTPVAEGSIYAVNVKIQPAGGTCTVTQGSGVVGSANVTNVAVACVANAFTTGGTISGLIGTVVLQNNGADTQTISTDGLITFPTPVTQGMPYAVTVLTQPMDQTCSVGNGTGTMGGVNVTNVVVVCSTNTFSIGGAVSGLIGSIVLQDNGGDALTISANGTFSFATPVAQGSTYTVTIQTQPATQTCTVGNGTATLGPANVSTVTVTCSTNAYTVGGTVSGLSGTVTLLDNGSDALALSANGSFTFPTPIAQGSTYNVTVQTQPVTQSCTVNNGSGTMGGSNVTNVTLTCANNDTTLSVSATGTIPVNGGSATLTVTNTGVTSAAYNVQATLPAGWIAVTQDATNCASIAPNGGTCSLTFTSTAPYVAQGNISITGDNITAPPATALAFTVGGYLVFSVDSLSSASVIDTADLAAAQWGTEGIETGATDLTNGASNTDAIVNTAGVAPSAAIDCNSSTSGGVTMGTWYLPAICQLAGPGGGASCPTALPNIDSNLFQLGFGGLNASPTYYWSSTEDPYSPVNFAVLQAFQAGGGSYQPGATKNYTAGIRCVRSVNY